jgi:hypothetical protein
MAAKNLLPSIRTTRVGMEFMEMVMFDDQWHDVHVNFIGTDGVVINKKAMRPLSFNALDVATGCDFTRSYKPIIWNEAEGKREMLTEADFFWFLIHVLTEYGWREDIGTTFVIEHGTASASHAIREAIREATQGKVIFQTGGILGAPLRKGMMFEGQPRGNFKLKAHRESWFNLFRNYSSGLIGASGRNPENAPEEQYGLAKYNNMLLRAMEKLPPARAALLQHPLLNWHQYVPLAEQIAELINRRIDHDLEGWEAMGHIAHEVRLHANDDRWLGMAEIEKLDTSAQTVALALMRQPGYGRSRNLSPREVFDMGRATAPIRKLSPRLWNIVIPNEYAYTAKVTDQHEIIIRDRLITPEPLIFTSLVKDDRGREIVIHPGEEVRVYMNPFKPQHALICEPNDSAIGIAHRMMAPSRLDTDGIMRATGTVRHLEKVLQARSTQRAQGIMNERSAMKEHNERVLTGKPVTEAEHEAATAAEEVIHFDEPPAATFEEDDADVQLSD